MHDAEQAITAARVVLTHLQDRKQLPSKIRVFVAVILHQKFEFGISFHLLDQGVFKLGTLSNDKLDCSVDELANGPVGWDDNNHEGLGESRKVL